MGPKDAAARTCEGRRGVGRALRLGARRPARLMIDLRGRPLPGASRVVLEVPHGAHGHVQLAPLLPIDARIRMVEGLPEIAMGWGDDATIDSRTRAIYWACLRRYSAMFSTSGRGMHILQLASGQ